MNAVLLCGSAAAGIEALDAVRAKLTTAGRSITGPEPDDGGLRGVVTGETVLDAAVVLVGAVLDTPARHDAYLLWQLGVPLVFALAAEGPVAQECERFAARLGHPGVPCVGPGETAAALDRLDASSSPVTVTVADAQNPEVASPAAEPAPLPADQIRATVAWSGREPLLRGRSYTLRSESAELMATVAPIKHRLDLVTLEPLPATRLNAGEIGECELELDGSIATAAFHAGGGPGAFVLHDRLTAAATGIGIVRFGLRRAANLRWQATSVDAGVRGAALGQTPCVLWLTGLSGAGKSTIADRVEAALQARGRHTYLLDGDNVRHGLNRDLGFSDADRVENIRRVAEVARLMADAGLIVLVSFISPFASERAMARSLFAPGSFYEVFVDAPLAVTEARDPKGLYAKARRGELANFTGIDSPYEPPRAPELRLDTDALSADEAAAGVLDLIDARENAGADRRGEG